MVDVQVLPADASQKDLLRGLMNLYLYDFSEYTGEDVNQAGGFTYGWLPRYWAEAERHPFLILVDGKPGGFVLVRDQQGQGEEQPTHHIAEFFILRKYRRMGVGRRAAWAVFDRFPGRWFVSEVEENLTALAFWRRVISEYTGGDYEEKRVEEWEGPVQIFQSKTGLQARSNQEER